MKRLIRLPLLLFALMPLSQAVAGHETPLYQAACHYREAVREFERGVFRAHCFGHYDERLVDRLEDATSRLRSATRHPEKIDRLLYEWDEVQSLQPRVAAAIFNPDRYPHHPELAVCWQRVTCAGQQLANELLTLQIPLPRHHHIAPPHIRSYDRVPAATFEGQPPRFPVTRPNLGSHGFVAPPRPSDRANYGGEISVARRGGPHPQSHASPANRVEPSRRDVGAALVGAMLTRLLD